MIRMEMLTRIRCISAAVNLGFLLGPEPSDAYIDLGGAVPSVIGEGDFDRPYLNGDSDRSLIAGIVFLCIVGFD